MSIFEISIHLNNFWTRMHLKFWHNVYLAKILTNTKLHYQLLCKTCCFSILHYLFKFIGSHTTLGRWQVGQITVATARWHHVPDRSSTKFFGVKFWQHGNVSAQQFIYMGTTIATGSCHHQLVANVIRISIVSF
jgi:hypothetical protein